MKNKTIGNKVKRRNNEGKRKVSKTDKIDYLLKRRALLMNQFESGEYDDLEHAYDILDDLKHVEALLEDMSDPSLTVLL